MDVTLMYFDECPNWRQMSDHLDTLCAELPDLTVTRVLVESDAEAVRLGFTGSPSILVSGTDPFAVAGSPVGLACRVYSTPAGLAGSPTLEQLREALTRAA